MEEAREGLWILMGWLVGLSSFLIPAALSMASIDRVLINRKGKAET
jgi:hypothetical protein